jgi:hypothetical protein
MECPGLISADTVEIHISHVSHCSELAGSVIAVTESATWMERFGLSQQPTLTVSEVSADNITLENTTAHTVRGDSVNIGKHCHIDCVEYRGLLTLDPGSWVGTSTKIE